MGDAVKAYFKPEPLSEDLNIADHDTLQDFEPFKNLSSDFYVWYCVVLISTTPRCHIIIIIIIINLFKVDNKKITSSKFITIVIKLININQEHSSVKTIKNIEKKQQTKTDKKNQKKQGVLNKLYMR